MSCSPRETSRDKVVRMIELRADGKITIDFDDAEITLRIPRIREFAELLAFASSLDDELDSLGVKERIKEGEASTDEIEKWAHQRRSIASRFAQRAISVLGDSPPPPDLDDYPAFLQDFSLPARFQLHWQTVPLGSSDRGARKG